METFQAQFLRLDADLLSVLHHYSGMDTTEGEAAQGRQIGLKERFRVVRADHYSLPPAK